MGPLTELWKSTAAAFAAVPPAVYGAILLVVAIVVAMVVHRALLAAARRALAARHPEVHALLTRMQGPLLLALVLLAVSLELPMLPFDPDLRGTIGRILQLAFICLAGWMTLVCLDVSSAIYLRRFDLGAEDNLLARKHVTQVRVLRRTLSTLIVLITVAAALMTFDSVRQFGIGLFASAGIAGIVVGLAARPVLSNLLAGVQIAVTQPIRIDDSVVVENESGRIEDITSTYVVVKLWDLRRLIVPLSYFIERPFQNWTRDSSTMHGTVFVYADHSVPVERVREQVAAIVANSKNWDGDVAKVQVTDAKESSIELRVLLSARDSGALFELRCEVREGLIAFLQRECPDALPRQRQEVVEPRP